MYYNISNEKRLPTSSRHRSNSPAPDFSIRNSEFVSPSFLNSRFGHSSFPLCADCQHAIELHEPHAAPGELADDFHLAAQGVDDLLEGRHLHVAGVLELGEARLFHLQLCGQRLLAVAARPAKLRQQHL